MSKRFWTEEEKSFLKEQWGQIGIPSLARRLNWSEAAVKRMAYKLNLGDVRQHLNGITIPQLAAALNTSISCVRNFITLYDLPYKKFAMSKRSFVIYVKFDVFWEWLEQNRQHVDFRKFERYSLGAEPEWVEEQRRLDQYDIAKQKYYAEWTAFEVAELKRMINEFKYTRHDIAKALNRTPEAITTKMRKLGLKLRPITLESEKKLWTEQETTALKMMIEQGYNYTEIAEKLGKSKDSVRRKASRLDCSRTRSKV